MQESSQRSDTGSTVGHFSPLARATFPKATSHQQLGSLRKHQLSHLSPTIQPNMATRWGLCGAGKISHDFSVAMKTLAPEHHQVQKNKSKKPNASPAPGQTDLYDSSALSTDSSCRLKEPGARQGLRQDARRSYGVRQLRRAGQQPGHR